MYIAKVPNRSSPPTYLLRESYREDGKVENGPWPISPPCRWNKLNFSAVFSKAKRSSPLAMRFA